MTETTVDYAVTDGVATVTLNRPEAANALDLAMARELMHAAIRCDEDPDDMPALLKEITVYLHAACSRFARMAPPLIVAVNGAAAGAGMSLSAVGDLALAADSASFTMAYTGIGMSPDGSSSYFLPRLIGLRRTQELMLTNRRLSAEEACEWGLINRVVPAGSLHAEVRELAGRLAAGPTRAHGTVKWLLAESFTNPMETQMELESRGIAASAATEDGREGINAFLNKRQPQFRNR